MAEVVNIPKVGPSQGGLARERSSLDGPIKKETPVKAIEVEATVIEKPTFLTKLKETFIAEDARDVGDYILWDILVPTIKRTIRDIIVGSTDRIFLGTSVPSGSSNLYRERGVTYVRRTDYGASSRKGLKASTVTSEYRKSQVNFGLDDVPPFRTREEAEDILSTMIDILEEYHMVSVDTYFSLLGVSKSFTAQNWGWRSLNSATIIEHNGGYIIKMPRPIVIKE